MHGSQNVLGENLSKKFLSRSLKKQRIKYMEQINIKILICMVHKMFLERTLSKKFLSMSFKKTNIKYMEQIKLKS